MAPNDGSGSFLDRLKSVFKLPSSWDGMRVCAVVASVALGVNVTLAVIAFAYGYANTKSKDFFEVPLYEGSCSTTRNLSTGLHLLINGLGTLVLSTSSYTSQFLAAPSRRDIDKAHSKGSWLDIGVHSLRNILALEGRKKFLWAVLLVSTIPIHAFVFVAPGDYNGSQTLNLTTSSTDCFEKYTHQSLADFNSDISRGNFDILTKQECLDTFARSYVHGYKSLAILSSDLTWNMDTPLRFVALANLPSYYDPSSEPWYRNPFSWMCPRLHEGSCLRSDLEAQMWKVSASIWQEPIWTLTLPRNHSFETFNETNFPECTDEYPFCLGMNQLSMFVWPASTTKFRDWPSLPITSQDLKTFVTEFRISNGGSVPSDLWDEILSFMTNVTWTQDGSRCTNFKSLNYRYLPGTRYTEEVFDYHSIGSYAVDGCLSTHREENCQLIFVPMFSIIVIVCIATKFACILFVSRRERHSRLLTVGDAISSFLSNPDRFTIGCCTSSNSDWVKPTRRLVGKPICTYRDFPEQRLDCRTRRWWKAATVMQWASTLVFALSMLGIASFFLYQRISVPLYSGTVGYGSYKPSLSFFWDTGIGSSNPYTVIDEVHSSFLGTVLLSNVPQFLLSLSYYFYNSTLTSMLLASEYDSYAIRGTRADSSVKPAQVQAKKGLRVSKNRTGAQRSFYFLSLPYRYSLPLMLSYTMLHWLVSQAFFYVRVVLYDENSQHDSSLDVDTCGWSPIALLGAIIVGSLMTITLVGLSMRSFRSVIPLAGSCSAAISAACHPPGHDVNAAVKEIIWGEISSSDLRKMAAISPRSLVSPGQDDVDDGDVALEMQTRDYRDQPTVHYTFTSCDVRQPTIDDTDGGWI
ncbi:unnamed protein product [Penicillium olsonii]|uniref:DUF6536 domain-containing protein n=1 Tax=Penicillium olsonii TaxID=99116 RepID=A0A9W4HTW8_PENOL|nr:unnamed protein product [Penicillium olsonii]